MKLAHTIAMIAASSFLTLAVAQAAPADAPLMTGRSAMMMHHHHHHMMMHKKHMMMRHMMMKKHHMMHHHM